MPEVSTIFTTVCVENRFNNVFTGKMMSTASSMTIEELIEEFDDLGDWADQCEILIDMGRELPDMPTELKSEQTKVHGCQSNVWMVASVSEDESRTIELIADSDAMIVRGLLTVIMMVYSGRTAQEIHDTDIKAIFSRLGLDRHLSTARKNGLGGMVNRVQTIARDALAAS
jgi:cysteine desulfuration protein SufE